MSVKPVETYWLIPHTRARIGTGPRPLPRDLGDFAPVPDDEDDSRIPDTGSLAAIAEQTNAMLARGAAIGGTHEDHYGPRRCARLVRVWVYKDKLVGDVEFALDDVWQQAVHAAVRARILTGISVEMPMFLDARGEIHYALTGFTLTDMPRMRDARVFGLPLRSWSERMGLAEGAPEVQQWAADEAGAGPRRWALEPAGAPEAPEPAGGQPPCGAPDAGPRRWTLGAPAGPPDAGPRRWALDA